MAGQLAWYAAALPCWAWRRDCVYCSFLLCWPTIEGAQRAATPQSFRSKSGSLAIFTAILRASSFVSNFAADRRPGFFRALLARTQHLLDRLHKRLLQIVHFRAEALHCF